MAALTTAQVAEKLDTTPRTLRKFLRQDEATGPVGKGSRHSIEGKQVASLKKRFNAWREAQVKVTDEAPAES